MSGGFFSSGGRRAHRLLLHHLRAPLSGERPLPPHAKVYGCSRLVSSKFREPSSSQFSPAAPSIFSSSSSSASATSAAAASTTRYNFVSWYLGMLEACPLLTKSMTAGTLFATASTTSQLITNKSYESIDWMRTLRMAGYGILITGPSLHFWFNFVSRILPKRDVLTTFKKMFLGQAVYGPIMTAFFFSVNAALQGETGSEIIARLKRDLIPTLINGLVYWPVCDFITFKFAPVRLQPLVSNSFSFVWTIYITYMASLEKAIQDNISTDSSINIM